MSNSELPKKLSKKLNEALVPPQDFADRAKASFLEAFDLLEDRRRNERRADAERRAAERRTTARDASDRRNTPRRQETAERRGSGTPNVETPANAPQIVSIEEFQKIDLRVGTISAAERVPGSEKLLKLTVNIGEERQILSGIAKTYAPEDLIGKEVVVITNLAPRKMMGLESQGMILAAHDGEGNPVLLAPREAVPPGAHVS